MSKRKKHSTPDQPCPNPGSSEPGSPERADAGGRQAPGASPEVGHPELDIRLYDMRLEYEQARERARDKRLVEQIKEVLVAGHAEANPAGVPAAPLRNRRTRRESQFTKAVMIALIDAPDATGQEITLSVDAAGVPPSPSMMKGKFKTYEQYYKTDKGRNRLNSRYTKIRRRMREQGLL